MKFHLKNTVYYFMLGASILLGTACNDDASTAGDNDDSLNVANNAANDSTSLNSGDRDFITDVVESDMTEIRIAQLAQQKAASAEVKQIAKTLENDHTASLNQLKDLASRKGLTLPTEEDNDGKELYNNLNEKTAKDFDREWIEKVMDKHDKAIKKFQDKAEDNNADADLKTWAASVLPKLRTHHDQLMASHNKMKK